MLLVRLFSKGERSILMMSANVTVRAGMLAGNPDPRCSRLSVKVFLVSKSMGRCGDGGQVMADDQAVAALSCLDEELWSDACSWGLCRACAVPRRHTESI